jgi:hypothetical protein
MLKARSFAVLRMTWGEGGKVNQMRRGLREKIENLEIFFILLWPGS